MDFTPEEKKAFLKGLAKIDWKKARESIKNMTYEEALQRVRRIDKEDRERERERDKQKESPV